MRVKIFVFLVLILFLTIGVSFGDTLRLTSEQQWERVSDNPSGEKMLAMSEFKRLVSEGQTSQAQAALKSIGERFEDLSGPELDSFGKAELLYSESKWTKAVKQYDEFLANYPDSWLYESALEREYSVAVAFLNGEKRRVLKVLKLSGYDDAVKVMQNIADKAGDSPIAQRSLLTLARGQDKMGKHLDAYETWADISSRWPTGDIGRDSLLGMAESLFHAYKGDAYDAASMISARSYYKNFELRYKELAVQYKIAERLKEIDELMASKQFSIGEYYHKVDNVSAANLYYQQVIDNWPQTAAAAEARKKLSGAEEEPEKKTFKRTMFEIGNTICDDWLGSIRL